MKTLGDVKQSGFGTFRRIGRAFLACIVPTQVKRMMMVSSLAAYLSRKTELDMGTLMRLNERFKLCTLESALQLPILLARTFWHGRLISEVVKDTVLRQDLGPGKISVVAGRIKESIPVWMRYDEQEMTADIYQLLNTRHQIMD